MKSRTRMDKPAIRSPASERTQTEPRSRERPAAVPDSLRQVQQTQACAQLRAPASTSGGLPEQLTERIAALSGEDLSDVRVHAASGRPAQLNAEAFAQGRDIHLAPAQERQRPHEAWHIVQQSQGRVRPTGDVDGQPLNDDPHLEREADAMGQRALAAQGGGGARGPSQIPKRNKPADEQRRREVIGGHHARKAPPVRWRQPGQPPRPQPGGPAPSGRHTAPSEGLQPDGPPRGNLPGDHVVIDIPDDDHAARNRRQRREATVTATTGPANLLSGAGRKPWRSYVKPGLTMLSSLIKCIGAVLYVSAAIAKASVDDADQHPGISNTNTVSIWAMSLGAAISVLHGIIKLLKVLSAEMRQSGAGGEEAEREDDDEQGHDDDLGDLELGLGGVA